MLRSACLLLLATLTATACTGATGPTGPTGPAGEPGTPGPQGPAYTPSAPPRIASLSPSWGSVRTEVTLVGENFSPEPANNRVLLDGVPATVVSASATRLVVRPSQAASHHARQAFVSVEVGQQTSNPMGFELVPSGTPRPERAPLSAGPFDAVRVGTDVYVASGAAFIPVSGLFKVEPDGRTTRVLDARSRAVLDYGLTETQYESIQGLTTDGTDLWYVTAFNAVRRYHVATGTVSEVALLPSINPTSIARSPGGFLYVMDQRGTETRIFRISPTGVVTTHPAPELAGGFDLVADGNELFVTNWDSGSVLRVTDAEGAFTFTPNFATGAATPLSVAVSGGKVIVSQANGQLLAVDRSTGGTLAPYLAPEGYGPVYTSLSAAPDGSLYLSQPTEGVLRKIAPGETSATIVAAGARLALDSVRMDGRWYFATLSPNQFNGITLPSHLQDSAVLELSEDGRSTRVVAHGGQYSGLAPLANGQLAMADCASKTISSLEPATGARTELLTAAQGLSCPRGLAVSPDGDLLYLDVGASGATIGRRTAQGVHEPGFVTGLPADAAQLVLAGERLLVLGRNDRLEATSLYSAEATGGVAAMWAQAPSLYLATALGKSPSGSVYLARANGDLLTVEPASGMLWPVGTTLTGPVQDTSTRTASGVYSLAFKPDGTAMMLDARQYQLITVTP